MQRFGRTAQHRMKDRWGGSFVLATVLALVGAWFVGNWLNTRLNPAMGDLGGDKGGIVSNGDLTPNPTTFNVYVVQAGAFRSEALAKKQVEALSAKDHMAAVGARTKDGFFPVYVGMYTDPQMASDLRERLKGEGFTTYTWSEKIVHNSDAVAAMATGTTNADLKSGIDLLNSYLHEVAMWMESHSAGVPMDTAKITAHGNQLADMASKLADATDEPTKQFAQMAMDASANAMQIEAAVNSTPSSGEYQAVMSGYLKLLNTYSTTYK